jgi:hypothetical protein
VSSALIRRDNVVEPVVEMTGEEEGAQGFEPLTAEQVEMGLVPTATPGVYRNPAGILVDSVGCMLSFTQVKERDQDRFERILGKKVESPAELLKAVTLDPTLPLAVRIDSAKSAAPYFDRRMPQSIDGGEDGKPILIEVRHKLKGMSMDELAAYENLIGMLGMGDEQDDD